jgi:hypothetical protein
MSNQKPQSPQSHTPMTPEAAARIQSAAAKAGDGQVAKDTFPARAQSAAANNAAKGGDQKK